MKNIKSVYMDLKKRLQTEEKEFYVSLNNKQELNNFADFYKNHVDFRNDFLSGYFNELEYNNLPVYLKFYEYNSTVGMSHQSIYGSEKNRQRQLNEYKEWIDSSIPFNAILNPDEYLEYFI